LWYMTISLINLRFSKVSAPNSFSLSAYCKPVIPVSIFMKSFGTLSIKTISHFPNGFHNFEQYSRIGRTNAVKALNKTDLFLDLKQFKIIEAFRLALLQVSFM